MKVARFWIVLGALLAQMQLAQAVDVPFSGALTANDPVFNRPLGTLTLSGVGTAVTYDVIPFYVTAPTTYVAEMLSASLSPGTADDTFIALYQTAFNPLLPLTNILATDDDTGVGSLSLIQWAMTAGTQYLLVVTTFSNGALGPYTGHLNTVTGAGQVILGSVPEVPTSAMLLLALGAFGLRARQRTAAAR